MTACQCILPEVIVKCFKKCHISNVVDGTDDGMLRNGGEDGMLRVCVGKMKALTVKM